MCDFIKWFFAESRRQKSWVVWIVFFFCAIFHRLSWKFIPYRLFTPLSCDGFTIWFVVFCTMEINAFDFRVYGNSNHRKILSWYLRIFTAMRPSYLETFFLFLKFNVLIFIFDLLEYNWMTVFHASLIWFRDWIRMAQYLCVIATICVF